VLAGFVIALAAWLVINALLLGLGVQSKFNFLNNTLSILLSHFS
jgi:hypothetical protein